MVLHKELMLKFGNILLNLKQSVLDGVGHSAALHHVFGVCIGVSAFTWWCNSEALSGHRHRKSK